ncbi:hypothetical protein KMZ68_14145 [Bradyrhizobium sediminis]|uniref:Uncharacterized protein n=1 Tax=Bradyrhizobium sediminis TaxID=2840469 RepID=A0A975RQR2_9BRAD|nr:hypothetical protein [Bradyrhizobium sediminis]QWG16184.1 hypothetical protein KMZ68_14145 [Bradyrhizobium sediminis]
MRRWRTVRQYRPHAVRDDAEVRIDAVDCRVVLDTRRHIGEVSRLMLEVAVRHGDDMMTFGDFKELVLRVAADAGSVKAAIKRLNPQATASRLRYSSQGPICTKLRNVMNEA